MLIKLDGLIVVDYLEKLIKGRAEGKREGIYSCCSANRDVLCAALLRAKQAKTVLLVEATANQVNQFGGYTGMTPKGFSDFVHRLANECDFPVEMLILGGDHLGPLVWSNEPENVAMEKAEVLVRQFVAAGYQKIHLDTSMRLSSDDPEKPLDITVCAERGARLCEACEQEYEVVKANNSAAKKPVYVIGSEVPIPGGETGDSPSDNITTVDSYFATLEAYKNVFREYGLEDSFNRIAAIVVEMGVEFSEFSVSDYSRRRFESLSCAAKDSAIGFEAHSTDYQTSFSLREMVEDGAMFLKVGPALTFAVRSALFKLELIEKEIVPMEQRSNFRQVLEEVMVLNPVNWQKYYKGTMDDMAFARAFSFSDRCRYYLSDRSVIEARERLISNLDNRGIPLCLVDEYFRKQYLRIRNGSLQASAQSILHDYIGDTIDDYLMATISRDAR